MSSISIERGHPGRGDPPAIWKFLHVIFRGLLAGGEGAAVGLLPLEMKLHAHQIRTRGRHLHHMNDRVRIALSDDIVVQLLEIGLAVDHGLATRLKTIDSRPQRLRITGAEEIVVLAHKSLDLGYVRFRVHTPSPIDWFTILPSYPWRSQAARHSHEGVTLYHRFRQEDLCRLKIKDIHPRRGVPP